MQHSSQNKNPAFYVRIPHMIIKPVRFYCMARHYKKANPVNSIQPPCCPVTEAVFSLRLSPAASVAVIYRFYELRLSVQGEHTHPGAMLRSFTTCF
ncbi:hypothetical protein WLH_03616 [Escherichia coli O25b:H4]|uniref:Uncharacterized protein n=2 Tax=Escherichia coli TaxID=562 RepID=A0A192CGL2_ECO25|nr:hypothetical protein UTI89_C4898 [Escherichia coli UTI89]ANK04877.1 hypothetical protein WLH_03616 [Escherichia coli O25b:H4]EFU54811.1 hypothetical protein HMPREF9544_00043 [Escherichia coli MS 153-1]EGB83384.1 hypothetical protein HMPREF9533_01786 [Escherichia coli MS 60-1]